MTQSGWHIQLTITGYMLTLWKWLTLWTSVGKRMAMLSASKLFSCLILYCHFTPSLQKGMLFSDITWQMNVVTGLSSLLSMPVSEYIGFPRRQVGVSTESLVDENLAPYASSALTSNLFAALHCEIRDFTNPAKFPRMLVFSQIKMQLWTRRAGKPWGHRPTSQFYFCHLFWM